ncbi:MAG: hypothetical protein OHK0046_30660 [Anaerolineae bacterium]
MKPDQIPGALGRVNQFGSATERLFSLLYNGLNRRSQNDELEKRTQQLAQRQEAIQQLKERNRQLQEHLAQRVDFTEKLHGILTTLDTGVIMQDLEGRMAYINRAGRDMLGSQKNFWESDLGLLFEEYRHVDRLSSEIEPLGEARRVQVGPRVLAARPAAVANDRGQRIGTMIVLHDITHEDLAAELKDKFVTAISHELKTPMTVIKGMSEVLLGQPDDSPANRRWLETLGRNVDILDRMVVELLDVSEMSAGQLEIRQDIVQIEPLVISVVNGLSPEVIKRRLEVKVLARDLDHLHLMGDAKRLRWALHHLLQNSVQYTEPGGHIDVQMGLNEANPQFLFVDFIDDGVGIAEKDQAHIFERFYRGDPRDADGRLIDPRGLGQGLFIAQKVAEAHGGHLGFTSTPGKGSVFTLTLPVVGN